jgi:DNA repair exonuclease SbcCD nuclease subunit
VMMLNELYTISQPCFSSNASRCVSNLQGENLWRLPHNHKPWRLPHHHELRRLIPSVGCSFWTV